MYKQIETFMRDKLSKLLTGLRKSSSTQHCLMTMLERWKSTLGKGDYVSTIFMDLSKALDTLSHNLLIAKLGAYGFKRDSFSFMKSYLSYRQQRVMKNSKEQTILELTIDNKLTFKSHIKNLCKKASQKISALSRLSNHLNDSQKRLVLKSIYLISV